MNFQVAVKHVEAYPIKLNSDEFIVDEDQEYYIIRIPKSIIKIPDYSLQNQIKEEYKNIPDDHFVPVPDFPNYVVNKNGELKNAITNKIVNQKPNDKGYKEVNIRDENNVQKYRGIHCLVAKTFLHNPRNLPHVNHKNHNPLNNTLYNVEWTSESENMYLRRSKKDLETLPNGCIKIDNIGNQTYDNLYYLDKNLYWKITEDWIKPYKLPKDKTATTLFKIKINYNEFIKQYPQFESDYKRKKHSKK